MKSNGLYVKTWGDKNHEKKSGMILKYLKKSNLNRDLYEIG